MSREMDQNEGIEQDLLAASHESMTTGRLMPLLKKELWLKIQARRLSEGKEELVVPSFSSPSYQISQAEKARKLRRQEQNRRAAKKFRTKEKSRKRDILDTIDILGESNLQLEEEKLALINQKNQILLQLCSHLQHCQASPTPIPPSLLKDTRLGTALPCPQSSSSPPCRSSNNDTTTGAEPERGARDSSSNAAGVLLTHETVQAKTVEENSCHPCLQNDGSEYASSGHDCLRECTSSMKLVEENAHVSEELNYNPSTVSTVQVHEVPFEEARLTDGKRQKKNQTLNDGNRGSTLEERQSTSNAEPFNSSAPSSDTPKPAGFECGVVFLQIVDGKVQIQRGDKSVIQVSPKASVPIMGTTILREKTTSFDRVPCEDETSCSHSGQSFQSCGEPMSSTCHKAPTITGDESSLGDQASLSSQAGMFIPSRDEKPSCSFQTTDQMDSGKKENTMVFYINQSRGLPFLVLTNSGPSAQASHEEQSGCINKSGTSPEPHDQLNDIPSAKNRGNSRVNVHISRNQTTNRSNPKTKSKRKLSKAHKVDTSRAPMKKRSMYADDSNLLMPLSEIAEPSPLHFTVYKDAEVNQQINEETGAANNVNENAHEKSGFPQTVKDSFLRDQTNIRNNQFCHASPDSKQSENGKDDRLSDLLENRSGSEDKDPSAFTNDNKGTPGNGCLVDGNTCPCASTTSTTEQTSTCTTQEQTSPASAVYTSEFRSFLTNCFESLNKKKVDEASPPTQGQLVLTSRELRFLSTNGQNQTDVEENDHDHELVPNVDSVCLMNVIKETNRYYADRKKAQGNDQDCGDNSQPLSCSLVLFSGLLLEPENTTTQSERNVPISAQGCLVLPENFMEGEMCPVLPSPATANQLPSRNGASQAGHDAQGVRESSPTLSQLFSDALPTIQSMTLSWSEHSQLVDTLLSGLSSSSDTQ